MLHLYYIYVIMGNVPGFVLSLFPKIKMYWYGTYADFGG